MDWWAIAAGVLLVAWLVSLAWLAQARRKLSRTELALAGERPQLKQMQAQRDSLGLINRSFIEEAPAAMLLVQHDGQVTYFNRSAADLFGLGIAAVGKHLIELVRDHDLATMVRRALEGGGAASMELTPPASKLILLATVRPITADNGSHLGAAVVLENLTEVRRLEAARRDLLANVSHELRTPLAGMKALVETLEAGAVEDPAAAGRFLRKLDGELDCLTFLVRDVLELSRIESGSIRLTLQPVLVDELVADAVDRVQIQAGELTVVVQDGALVEVIADPQRCEQVLVNLLQNAVKFSLPGGRIVVSWTVVDGAVAVHVRDTGIGIPADDLPRIFERFYKVDKARVHAQGSGTGLGLAIVKHLVTAMGGGVGVHSELGTGSDFWFTLPLAAAATALPAA